MYQGIFWSAGRENTAISVRYDGTSFPFRSTRFSRFNSAQRLKPQCSCGSSLFAAPAKCVHTAALFFRWQAAHKREELLCLNGLTCDAQALIMLRVARTRDKPDAEPLRL